ncbi:MAG TPA: NAD(P)H-binding protein [Puia sp.]|nr:NAD(P)H-binding protein [Puia sp.]
MSNLLIIGANGGIGRQAVELALEAGHQVTAVLRTPARLPLTHPLLQKVQGDVMYPETFEQAIINQHVVISALGVQGGMLGDKPTTLYSQGNANILRLMHKHHVRRGYFISASAVEISPVMPFWARFAAKYIVQKLLRHMYADLREMERFVKSSGLDWTIIRPPRLTNKPVTGDYRFSANSFLKNSLSISRGDLAHFMINNISNKEIYQAIVEIGY